MRPDMDKKMSYQLDIRNGEKIRVTAISTTDSWHNSRHHLLFQEFIVKEDVKRSPPTAGYDYRNWVSATLIPVNPTHEMNKLKNNGEFNFIRIQMRKVKKNTQIVNGIELLEKATPRERMLLTINAELNNKAEPIYIPENPFDVTAWYKLFNKGFHIQARKEVPNSNWYKAGVGTFNLSSRVKIEFRLKEN